VMAVLLDSGFLFASLNASEAEHQSTIQVLNDIREPIVLPVPAITEVAYLLARDIGQDAAADFIGSLAETELTLESQAKRTTCAAETSSGSTLTLTSTLWMH
jgi:predicted nucleic acid-binding protein